MATVDVIEPNAAVEGTLERHGLAAGPDEVRVLGFPKQLFDYHVEIPRRFLEGRELSMSTTVDLLTGACVRNDVYPDLVSRSYPNTALLEPRVDRSTATERSRSLVRRRVTARYKTFVPPEITVTGADEAYKLFWVVPTDGDVVTVLDTISGDVVERDVETDEVTRAVRSG